MKPGQRVMLRQSDSDERPIVGVVVWSYRNEHGDEDVYVAFFGFDFPLEGTPPEHPPFVLRYYAASLELVE